MNLRQKGASVVAVLALGIGLAIAAPLSASAQSAPTPTATPTATSIPSVAPKPTPKAVRTSTLLLFEKPAASFGPQTVVAHAAWTGDLNALDSLAQPGKCYQADNEYDGTHTTAFINGTQLLAPNNPAEDLVPGGEGVSYKTWCVPAPTPPAAPNPAATIASTCGTATVTVTNALSGATSRLTASVVVYVDGTFNQALSVLAGDTATSTQLNFAEDSGDHIVTVRTGPAFGDTLLATATVTSDCLPAIVPPPVVPPTDLCSNIAGVQTVIPAGDTHVGTTCAVPASSNKTLAFTGVDPVMLLLAALAVLFLGLGIQLVRKHKTSM